MRAYRLAAILSMALLATPIAVTCLATQRTTKPELKSPKNGAVMDNGRSDRKDAMLHEFEWSPVSGAEKYQLVVMGKNAKNPTIDVECTDTKHRKESQAYVPPQHLKGWTWKVRAFANGKWGAWSDARTFYVEPLNTDHAISETTGDNRRMEALEQELKALKAEGATLRAELDTLKASAK